MSFYNRHDIADAVWRYEDMPNAGQAARTLERLADWTDHNSDGWPYWSKPSNAAKRLVELLQSVDRYDPVDFTAEDLAVALRPVKAFLTRQGVDHAEILADPVPPVYDDDPVDLSDAEALDRLNYMLSAEEWTASFLEDACEIVRATGRVEIAGAEWESH